MRAIVARAVIGNNKKRLKRIDNSIIFVSYFPAVDKKAAESGKLRNKYAIPLQEKLSKMGKRIIWIWMYVFLDGHTYRDALNLAGKFTKNGEINLFLYEFMSPAILVRSFLLWLRQIRIFFTLRKLIPERVLYKGFSIPEANIFIRNLMIESFIGLVAMEGILYFEVYKEIFSRFSYSSHCLYYSEMHAWEKALNAAKRLKAPQIKSIAFQHTNVSQNFFHYFHHPSEIRETENSASLPLPDILACNGDIALSLLQGCGYPGIRKVEAVRHLYLSSCPGNSEFSKKENIILVTGSIDREETKTLISFFHEAFPRPKGFKVWLKGHPSLPFERILDELGIRTDDSGYIIKHDPISEMVKVAKVAVVGGSSVALEALASGCAPILPIFADHMFMSPMKGFERHYSKVKNPAELLTAVKRLMEDNGKTSPKDTQEFIAKCWCVDKSLRRWEEILKIYD